MARLDLDLVALLSYPFASDVGQNMASLNATTPMPFSYSADLRQKVLNAIDNGMRPSEASRVFQLSRNTINLWRRQFEQKGI